MDKSSLLLSALMFILDLGDQVVWSYDAETHALIAYAADSHSQLAASGIGNML